MAGNPYTWSTTAATNSSADSDINWAEGQLPGTVNDSARGMMAGQAGLLKDTNSTLTTGGSANAQTVTSNIAYPALASGLKLHLKAGFSNTAAMTLNLTPSGGGAFGAKAVKIINSGTEADPAAGQWGAAGHYIVEYDTAANSAAGAWMLLNPTADDFPGGQIFGLTLSNDAGDLTNDIGIAAGVAADSTNSVQIRLSSALIKELDVAWAVGSATGMRASGAAIANATYFIFLIRRPDTGVVDVAADTSASGANIAANTNVNYTQIRRIGSIIRAAGAIKTFIQAGDEFRYLVPVADLAAGAPGSSAATRTLTVPIGIVVWALMGVAVAADGGTAEVLYLSPLDTTDTAASNGAASTASTAAAGLTGTTAQVKTNTSGQIRSRNSSGGGTSSIAINTQGWIDRRGRDA